MQDSWLSAIVALGIVALGLVSGFSAGTARAAKLSVAELTVAELTVAELSVAELSEMEQLLAQLNFDPGVIDGEVDDRTRTAIRLYQEFAILPVNGEPSAKLLRELRQISLVFAEMRKAEPEPEPKSEPEIATPAEPDPAPTDEVAAAEQPPEFAPETPEPPAKSEPVAEVVAPEPVPEPGVAEPVEPEPVLEPEVAEQVEPEPMPEPEVAEPVEPEPVPEPKVAEQVEPEPVPEPEVAEPVEPEPEPEPIVAEPAPISEPATAEPQIAEAMSAEPEAEQVAAKTADPPPNEAADEAPKAVPEAAESPAEPPATPKAAAGFNIAGMIARLKQRDHVEAPATSTQAASNSTPTTPTDRAGRERTLIWNVQQELRRIGLDPGAPDGNMRTRTTDAIATYQRARGLPADGRVTEALLARLETEVTPTAPRPPGEATALGSVSSQAAAIDAAPSNGYRAFQAGYSVAQSGDFGAAVKLYDRAIDSGDLALEHLAAALYNRANAYQYLGVMDKAIADYSAAIANKPGFPAAYYNRGFALDKKGEQVRAVKDFRTARDLGLQRLGVRSPDLPPPLL